MLAAVAAKPVRGQVKQAPETIPDSAVIGRLLDSAFATFKDGYLASQITSPMRARTDDPAEIAEIDRREVTAYRDEADARERHGKAIPPAERHQPLQDTRVYGADQAGHRTTPGDSREGPRPEEIFFVDAASYLTRSYGQFGRRIGRNFGLGVDSGAACGCRPVSGGPEAAHEQFRAERAVVPALRRR
jgi:hypothetical protein